MLVRKSIRQTYVARNECVGQKQLFLWQNCNNQKTTGSICRALAPKQLHQQLRKSSFMLQRTRTMYARVVSVFSVVVAVSTEAVRASVAASLRARRRSRTRTWRALLAWRAQARCLDRLPLRTARCSASRHSLVASQLGPLGLVAR